MNLVLDCSVILSSLLPDEKQPHIQYSLYKIYVPVIFYMECNNVLLSSINRKRIDSADYQEYLLTIQGLPINVDKLSASAESLYFISELAIKNSLSSYDASYLELAIRLKAKMATIDNKLIKACNAHQVEVVN